MTLHSRGRPVETAQPMQTTGNEVYDSWLVNVEQTAGFVQLSHHAHPEEALGHVTPENRSYLW